jgi:hypothetical protein
MQIEEFNKLLNVPMNMTCDDGRKFAGIRFLTNSVVLKIINQKYLPVSNWWKIELVLEER